MAHNAIGSQEWLTEIFESRVRQEVFSGHAANQTSPVLILLGGQPAAGKTQAQSEIVRSHPTDDLVEITGDDLREFHPNYHALSRHHPLEMPGETAPVSGGLVALSLDYAFDNRYSVLLEGTFRNRDMVASTARHFAEAGYRVEVVAVAAPAALSRLSSEMRSLDPGYPEVGRWTPPEAHESAVKNSAGVLEALEEYEGVKYIQVATRSTVLYENTRTESGQWEKPAEAVRVLTEEQHRQLSVKEASEWLNDYAGAFKKAQARPDYLCAKTLPKFIKLQDDALAMIECLARESHRPIDDLMAEQQQRTDALTQIEQQEKDKQENGQTQE